MHFNIRSLKNKISEEKNIIKNENPTIFGLSECEIRKQNVSADQFRIQGYKVLFPKSWDCFGFARVLVYVKENFEFEQVNNLEHDIIQSVWLRGGYKNGKKAYFCHGYREHSSMLGSTINDQKTYLNNFLQQWEDAVDHGQPSEPNEVHFSLEMNLDYQKENWLQPSYRLCSLTRLVQNICNANNFTQIINEPTRSMYNSVTATTEISCIDHIYTNARYKISSGIVIVSGASDHNIVCFTRYTKVPPIPGRVIHKRSLQAF